MSDNEEKSVEDYMRELEGAAAASREVADNATASDFASIKADLDKLESVAGLSIEDHKKLIDAVQEYTDKNIAIGELENRVRALAEGAGNLWDEVKPLLGAVI